MLGRSVNKRDRNRRLAYEGQIPSDLTFNWNIINKRKKQENITREIEVKNNLTIARGEWGGDTGKRGLQELL